PALRRRQPPVRAPARRPVRGQGRLGPLAGGECVAQRGPCPESGAVLAGGRSDGARVGGDDHGLKVTDPAARHAPSTPWAGCESGRRWAQGSCPQHSAGAVLSTPRAPSSARTVRIAARCGILQLPDPAAQKDAMTFAPAPRPGSAGPPPPRPRRPLWHWLLLGGAGMALLLVA